MKKKFIEKMEKMVDVFFSDAWQSKVFAMIFSIFGVICFIAGFWNYIHFFVFCNVWINGLCIV